VAAVALATSADVSAIVALHESVARDLTCRHGRGPWSSVPTERSVLSGLDTSTVLVTRRRGRIVGSVRVAAKKPWAIDPRRFAAVAKAVYLHALAVAPPEQGRGIGRLLVEEATAVARAWPSDAIRLDAYDHPAGAGGFYAKCGFREVGNVTYRGVPLTYFELLL
jgi:GNAT superfamily N-acetyltransferase